MKITETERYIQLHIPIDKLYFKKHHIPNCFLGVRFSPSFIKSWQICHAKSFLQIFNPSASKEINIGNIIHKLLEEKEDNNLSEKEVFRKAPKEAIPYLISYFSLEPIKGEVFTEKKIVESYKSYELSGVIDKIVFTDDVIYIIDYKTSKHSINLDWYKDQLILYKYLVKKHYNVKDKTIKIGIIEITPYNAQYRWLDITDEDESILLQKTEQIKKAIEVFKKEKKLYKNIVPKRCQYCNLCEWE